MYIEVEETELFHDILSARRYIGLESILIYHIMLKFTYVFLLEEELEEINCSRNLIWIVVGRSLHSFTVTLD